MLRIGHIIPSLDFGGAEKQLLNLAMHDSLSVHSIIIFSALNQDFIRSHDLRNVTVVDLSHMSILDKLISLIKIFRGESYDVIQCWMYHACLISVFFSNKRIPVIWNIRRSGVSIKSLKIKTYLIVRFLAIFSKLIPDATVYCASTARDSHVALGFRCARQKIIYNGFTFSGQLEKTFPKIVRLGFVGRNVTEKNFEAFFQFLLYLEDKKERVTVNIVGRGYDEYKRDIVNFEHVVIRFAGEVSNMDSEYSDMDLIFSTSSTEGFPNVIAEAMGFGVLPLCSDAGDSLFVAGDYGIPLLSLAPCDIYRSFQAAKLRLNAGNSADLRSSAYTRFGQQKANDMYMALWEELTL